MSKRLLTKMMAGVALAGVALLMSAPSATIAGDFDFFGHDKFGHDKFKGTGFISGIAVVDTGTPGQPLGDVVVHVTKVCSKQQKAQPFAKILLDSEDIEKITIPLELKFPGLDLLFKKLLHDKFDKFDKFDHHAKMEERDIFDKDDTFD
jgi:hypothetical protein